MKRLLFIAFILWPASYLQAQTDGGTGLQPLVFPEKRDTVYLNMRLEKISGMQALFPDSAVILFKEIFAQSQAQEYTWGIIRSLTGIGNIYADKSRHEQALHYYTQAVHICETGMAGKTFLPVLWNNMGIVYDARGQYMLSATAFTKAAQYYDRFPSLLTSKGKILQNLAGTFTKLKQYDKAAYYLNATVPGDDWNLNATILNNKGAVAALQQKLEESRLYFEQSLTMARQHNLPNTEAELNLGNIYFLQKKADKAIPLLNGILGRDSLISEDNKIAAAHILGQIFLEKKQYGLARSYLLEALQKSNRFNIAEKRLHTELSLSELYEATGDFEESLKHKNNYTSLKDSIDNKEIAQNINLLETRYRTAQKDKELLEKKLRISNQENGLKTKNALILAALALSTFLGILLFLLYRYHKQKQAMHEKQVRLLQHQQEIEELKAIMKGEEQERERLARNLHDGIGGMLVSAKLNLGSIREIYPETPCIGKIDDVMHMLQNTSSEVRRTAHNLMPEILTRASLEDAIGMYCDELNTGNRMEIDIQFQGDFSWLQKSPELLVYRMVQELVQNVIKHAGADYMAVLLRYYDETLSITVEDNGSGFEQEKQYKGFGLYSLKHRVTALRGEISIMSAPGRNTTVFIAIDKERLIALD